MNCTILFLERMHGLQHRISFCLLIEVTWVLVRNKVVFTSSTKRILLASEIFSSSIIEALNIDPFLFSCLSLCLWWVLLLKILREKEVTPFFPSLRGGKQFTEFFRKIKNEMWRKLEKSIAEKQTSIGFHFALSITTNNFHNFFIKKPAESIYIYWHSRRYFYANASIAEGCHGYGIFGGYELKLEGRFCFK